MSSSLKELNWLKLMLIIIVPVSLGLTFNYEGKKPYDATHA